MSDDKVEKIWNATPQWIFHMCGSLIAITISLKVIGFDAQPLIDAYSQKLIADIERTSKEKRVNAEILALSKRIDKLEDGNSVDTNKAETHNALPNLDQTMSGYDDIRSRLEKLEEYSHRPTLSTKE